MKTKTFIWLVIIAAAIIIAHQIDERTKTRFYPANYEIKDFPLCVQPDGLTCGPTAIKMVLKYYGHEVELKEIRKKAKTDLYVKNGIEVGGTQPEYERIAMEDLGVPCKIKSIDINFLKFFVSQNKPVITCVRSGGRLWHWVVVIGYTPDSIIIADPGDGSRQTLPTNRFENAWSFVSDLDGTDLTNSCKACNGTGYWSDVLGPLGKCAVCDGTGKQPDWYCVLVEWGELRGHVAVIPNDPKPIVSQ
jgi:hypothetical protein